jgi:ribonuclease HI
MRYSQGLRALVPNSIFTPNGSCKGGTQKGGAAAVITDGPFSNPNCIDVKKMKGNLHNCSYEEEKRALILGIDWLREHPGYRQVAFCTDSLSLSS